MSGAVLTEATCRNGKIYCTLWNVSSIFFSFIFINQVFYPPLPTSFHPELHGKLA